MQPTVTGRADVTCIIYYQFFVFYTMQNAQKHEPMHMRELRRKHGSCWAFIILFLLIDNALPPNNIDKVYDTDDGIADGSIILHPIKIHNSR